MAGVPPLPLRLSCLLAPQLLPFFLCKLGGGVTWHPASWQEPGCVLGL